jgi:hypothetical protein
VGHNNGILKLIGNLYGGVFMGMGVEPARIEPAPIELADPDERSPQV